MKSNKKIKINYAARLIIRNLGLQPYPRIWQAMRDFTDQRNAETTDELWLLRHQPVFTQGQAGKAEHILDPHQIPVIQTDRGGQVTYHGPGQLIAYPLLDLSRRSLTIRSLVTTLEQSIIDLLSQFNLQATAQPQAPGVYVDNNKICSIGLRVRRGCSFHGIALNVDMDLTPFSYINPCGFRGLTMTQLSHYAPGVDCEAIIPRLIDAFIRHFGYTQAQELTHELPTL